MKKWAKILRWKDTAHKNAFRRRDFLVSATHAPLPTPLRSWGLAESFLSGLHWCRY